MLVTYPKKIELVLVILTMTVPEDSQLVLQKKDGMVLPAFSASLGCELHPRNFTWFT